MLLPIVVFLAVSTGCIGLVLWLAPDRTEQRLNALGKEKSTSQAWSTKIVDVVTPFARLSTPSGDWETSPLRVRFMNAGIRHPKAPHVFFGLKTLLPVLAAVPTFLMLRATQGATGMSLLLWVLGAATLGCYLPNIALSMAGRGRRHDILDSFPDAADLLLVCVEAGLGLDAALTRVAEELQEQSPALAEELQLTNLEMRAGGTREKSLRNLALRTGVEEIATFATMLTQSDRFGTSIGESLRVFSDDLRHKRQVRAEELAAKVPTKMLVPLVLCIFPCISAVILTPAAIRVVRMIIPMLNGTT